MKHLNMSSPVGKLQLITSDKGLCAILWENERENRVRIEVGKLDTKNPILLQAKTQLNEYFKGQRHEFDVPLDMIGTSFQIKVWRALTSIPYGETASYFDIACKINQPTAARAVGMANGKNPLSIIVPCHRIIGANGGLTGYAGGLPNKKILLELEGANVNG